MELLVEKNETIDVLNLPPRVVNALRRSRIHEIKDLLNCDQKRLSKIRNLGAKGTELVLEFFDQVAKAEIVVVEPGSYLEIREQPQEEPGEFRNLDGLMYLDRAIGELPFNDVIIFALNQAGYHWVSQLYYLGEPTLAAIAGLSAANVKIIMKTLATIKLEPVVGAPRLCPERLGFLVYQALNPKLDLDLLDFQKRLNGFFAKFLAMQDDYDLDNCLNDQSLLALLKENRYLQQIVNDRYLRLIEALVVNVIIADLGAVTPELLHDESYIEERLDDLLGAAKIWEIQPGRYASTVPSVLESQPEWLSDLEYAILLERSQNKSIDSTAQMLNLERYQVIKNSQNALAKLKEKEQFFREDGLGDLYIHYQIPMAVFVPAFCDSMTYGYLKFRYFSDRMKAKDALERKPMEQLLEDASVSAFYKQQLASYLKAK